MQAGLQMHYEMKYASETSAKPEICVLKAVYRHCEHKLSST
jgi:hypothetical protein